MKNANRVSGLAVSVTSVSLMRFLLLALTILLSTINVTRAENGEGYGGGAYYGGGVHYGENGCQGAVNGAGVLAGAGASSQTIGTIFMEPSTLAAGGIAEISAAASSCLAVSFSSTTPSICTTSGNIVTAISAGTCVIAANQAGNASYSAAPQVTQSFVIGAAGSGATTGSGALIGATTGTGSTAQTIGAISFLPATIAVGGTATVSATASSGLAVTFSSLTPSICSVSGNTVTDVAAGTCTIAADQAGNTTYSAATEVTQSITISATSNSQTIGTISFSPTTIAVGGTGAVSATASSGLAVTFTSLTPGICTITASKSSLFSPNIYTVTGVAAGTCKIAADQAGGTVLLGATYSAAPQVTQSITIGTSQTDCIFNWVEKNYSQYFSPAATADATYVTYTYRYYSGTGNYIAISSDTNELYVTGTSFGNNLLDVGSVTSFLSLTGCQ